MFYKLNLNDLDDNFLQFTRDPVAAQDIKSLMSFEPTYSRIGFELIILDKRTGFEMITGRKMVFYIFRKCRDMLNKPYHQKNDSLPVDITVPNMYHELGFDNFITFTPNEVEFLLKDPEFPKEFKTYILYNL